ncbi:MAG: hypothetical protein QQW96_24790 [Tychonema bourrellyi B0820]|uniref:hypothetical protein n=1 Tax=Tychonema bourrellyi TaxID=54313 RepID=UPI00117D280A|nr:hypothetical protein [Tychonema bourrellyi]MDQ2100851.1 hypothetical protein [Tychonema bourrellyi B0820]
MVSLAIGQLYCDRTIMRSQISIVLEVWARNRVSTSLNQQFFTKIQSLQPPDSVKNPVSLLGVCHLTLWQHH